MRDLNEIAGLDRRRFTLAAAGFAAFGATGAMAQSHGDHHAGHGAHVATKAERAAALKAPEVPAAYKKVIEAARTCDARGKACRVHCIQLIRKGDLSLEGCLRQVNVMLPVCAATASLATQNARRFKEIAKLCLDICTDCAAECKKHAAHHAQCKACMEACEAMIAALKPVLA